MLCHFLFCFVIFVAVIVNSYFDFVVVLCFLLFCLLLLFCFWFFCFLAAFIECSGTH